MKKQMHKLDSIFGIGTLVIGIIAGMIDIFGNTPFPVYTCSSIYLSYGLLILLLIYSSFKYHKKEEKPKYVRGYMFFCLAFLHVAFSILGFIIAGVLKNLFNL